MAEIVTEGKGKKDEESGRKEEGKPETCRGLID